MRFGKYCCAQHCGGLKECLDTENPITEEVFNKLVQSGVYKFYAFDQRINADRYLLVDLEHNFGLPAWLHVYKEFDFNENDS